MKIAIIGGGAGGLFAGGMLSQAGIDTTIFDGNEKLGKKLYITGKGRCNVTNNCSKEEFLSHVVHGEKFMMSAISNFDSQSTMSFFENLGCHLKVERGNRVFPVSDKASDITKALIKNIDNSFCKIKLNEKVLSVSAQEGNFVINTSNSNYTFDKIIIATGGKSYPSTGSQGDGYILAKNLGHNIVPPMPALVPIKLKDNFCQQLQGLTLKNVKLKTVINGKTKEFFGELLFANDAITGPIALSASSYMGDSKPNLSLDLKPALDHQTLEKRIMRDFQNNLNREISYIIRGLMPKSLAGVFLKTCDIDEHKKVNSITTKERNKIIDHLKNFPLHFDSLYPVEAGIVTAGGVDLKEVNPKTMESKKVKDLYFVGEVLDIDCLTGGFNLQTAFSTAYACAKAIIESRKN